MHRHFDQSSSNTHTIRADTYEILSLPNPQSPPTNLPIQGFFLLKKKKNQSNPIQSNTYICALSVVCRLSAVIYYFKYVIEVCLVANRG